MHAGVKTDPLTGAVMTLIYATSTYAHDRPGEHKGYEYSRSQNPTREVLENSIANWKVDIKHLHLLQGLRLKQRFRSIKAWRSCNCF